MTMTANLLSEALHQDADELFATAVQVLLGAALRFDGTPATAFALGDAALTLAAVAEDYREFGLDLMARHLPPDRTASEQRQALGILCAGAVAFGLALIVAQGDAAVDLKATARLHHIVSVTRPHLLPGE